MYQNDKRIVMTLDAGGTNFVFSAIQGNREVIQPLVQPSFPEDLEGCLKTLTEGFRKVRSLLSAEPVAISFAFPGPADYVNGIIGDLPNFPSFRGGVPLKAYLEKEFGIPVFINNDGNLFALGEAMAGCLPQVNKILCEKGSTKRYTNLLALTLGTGFGAGVVVNGSLLLGDNGCGGDIWVFRNKKHPDKIVEESVSIRGIQRIYTELSGENGHLLTPREIFRIAEGEKEGNRPMAIQAFREVGEVAADAVSHALTIVDGLVVLGGGLTGAANYFLPAFMQEMNTTLSTFSGESFGRLQMKAFNLNDEKELEIFSGDTSRKVKIPFSEEEVIYSPEKRTGVLISSLGASRAIALGAYAFALQKLTI
ncbi:MAG: ROK family protein [Tannerellaceae bacterium]|nr:ROK family protein [Tannerellaceae bacterium]